MIQLGIGGCLFLFFVFRVVGACHCWQLGFGGSDKANQAAGFVLVPGMFSL